MVTSDDFWGRFGQLSECERAFLAQAGMSALYVNARTDEARGRALAHARRVLAAFRDNVSRPSLVIESQTPTDGSGGPDPRWSLLRDLELECARCEQDEYFAVQPAFSVRYEAPSRGYVGIGGKLPPHGWVTIRFDDRLSLAGMYAELQRAWPTLRAAASIPTRRPLGERKLDLIRFICLDPRSGNTWQERVETWNATHPGQEYADRRALLNAFQKAARSLTGEKDGLRWYYDVEYRDAWLPDLRDELTGIAQTILEALPEDHTRGGDTDDKT